MWTWVAENSASKDKVDSLYASVPPNSGRWESVYSVVTGNSAAWNTSSAAAWVDDGTVIRLTTAGDNVAIGTAGDTGVKLSIAGSVSSSGGLSATAGLSDAGYRFTNKNYLHSWTGLGTLPSAQLHVNAKYAQDSYSGRVAQFDSDHHTSWLGFTSATNKPIIGVSGEDIFFGKFYIDDSTLRTQMRIASSGYVGINVDTPTNLLHVYGSENHLGLFESSDTYALLAFKDGTAGEQDNETWLGGYRRNLIFGTQNSTRMIVTSAGIVGINTEIPTTSHGAYNNIKLHVNGQALADAWPTTSDERLKENIVRIDNGLSKITSLTGITFDWEDNYASDTSRSPGRRQIGIIAQEVEQVLPELVTSWSLSGQEYLAVDYARMVAVLVEAVKELKQEIDELKSQNS
jgi:hypothetical protein